MRTCTRCGEEKKITEFSPYNRVHRAECRECRSSRNKIYHASNREEDNLKVRKWRSNNKEKAREAVKRWTEANPERAKDTQRRAQRKHYKYAFKPKQRVSKNFARLIRSSIKQGTKANRRWKELVGFTIDQLKTYLEKKFKPGMTWENYGTYWHIDHKTPVAVFNFNRPEDIDFRLCWSLKNLQPLEAKENLIKRCKITAPFQPSLAMEA